jgi:2-C-methyl-D-erythritol 2,4-cyclodiphosphate synthase
MVRAGIGYDSHRLVEGRPLILAGQRIPSDRGLAGHSDADAVAHAVTDAILGATAAGDIGTWFPDTDQAWKDADSLLLLRRARERVEGLGYRVGQVDLTIILERPTLAPHKAAMAAALGRELGIETGQVSIKAKTNEGMGFIGRGEGIAVLAVATVESAR